MEIESKYALRSHVSAEEIEAMQWTPYTLGDRNTIDQHDTFFDTAELALSRTRHAVRLRKGSQTVVTLKGPGKVRNGVHSREELELPTDNDEPEKWPQSIRDRLDDLIGSQSIAPILSVHNNRRTWALLHNGDEIGEVALDEGTIAARDQHEPMHELEIELKGGSEDDLTRVDALVRRQLPATPEDRSKFARGIALLRR